MTLSIDRASVSAARTLLNRPAVRRACGRRVPIIIRHKSSEVKSQSTVSTRHRVLTLLHKTRALLPRALPSTESSGTLATGALNATPTINTSLELWDTALSDAHHTLQRAEQGDARVNIVCELSVCFFARKLALTMLNIVYGIDGSISGIDELVSALLVEPFSSSAAAKGKTIEQRWHGVAPTTKSISIE
jgi:hypothetical protein